MAKCAVILYVRKCMEMKNLVGVKSMFVKQETFRFIQFLRVLMLCMSSLLYNKYGSKRVLFGLDRCPRSKCLSNI